MLWIGFRSENHSNRNSFVCGFKDKKKILIKKWIKSYFSDKFGILPGSGESKKKKVVGIFGATLDFGNVNGNSIFLIVISDTFVDYELHWWNHLERYLIEIYGYSWRMP